MAINKRLISYPVAAADTNLPSEYFNTVLYTGNGGSQRVGGYINRGFISKSSTAGVEIPNVENLFQRKDTEYSVSVWFNGTPNAYAGEIFSDYADESFTSYIYINATGYLQVEVRMNTSPTNIISSAVVNDGEWHHVVYTYKNSTSTIKMYLDGSLVGSGTIPSSAYNSSSGSNVKITFGSVWYPPTSSYSNGLNGVIDHARIFDRVVTSSEVTTLYGETHASTTISTTDIFSDGSGVALYQFDGNANDTGGVNGKFGAAAIFNGSSSIITLPNSIEDGIISSGAFSVTGWFKTDTVSSRQGIVSLLQDMYLIVEVTSGGVLKGIVSNSSGTNTEITGTTSLTAGTFYHFAFTGDSAKIELFLDNSSEGSSTAWNGSWYASSNVTPKIGTIGSNYFDGVIDDIRIYSDELTSVERGLSLIHI